VYSGFGSSKEFCKDVFSAFDKNKNGYIEFDEFIYAIGLSFSLDIRDKIDLAFDVFDRNKDGVISRKEAEKILKVFQLVFLFKFKILSILSQFINFEVNLLKLKKLKLK
jgi:Ca2+-binding EF-hand superfamily protein